MFTTVQWTVQWIPVAVAVCVIFVIGNGRFCRVPNCIKNHKQHNMVDQNIRGCKPSPKLQTIDEK